MKVSYFLTRPESQNETSIYTFLSVGGEKFKYYIGEKIVPSFWNPATKSAKQTSRFSEYPEFNQRLRDIASIINKTLLEYKNGKGEVPSVETFRELLDRAVRKIEPKGTKAVNFFAFFTQIMEETKNGLRMNLKTGKPICKSTLKKYWTTFQHLKKFQSTRKRPIEFNNIDLDFYEDFKKYLIQEKNLSTNAIGKYIQTIKLIMNEATERGLNSNLAFKSKRFKVLQETSDDIYLTEKEIEEISKLDLSDNKRLEPVRDLFLIGCYTGLRFSDFSKLTSEQLNSDFIEIKAQEKTQEPVLIPIDERIEKIIRKYGGEFPKAISNQKTNQYLKEIGKKVPCLNKEETSTITKGGMKVSRNFKKWQLISTHTARRSFATNEYNQGTPSYEIMAITGHKTEKAFLKYIKMTQRDHAHSFKKRKELRSQSLLKAV